MLYESDVYLVKALISCLEMSAVNQSVFKLSILKRSGAHGFVVLFQARAFLQAAASLAPHMYEPHYNHGLLSHKVCNHFLYHMTETTTSL